MRVPICVAAALGLMACPQPKAPTEKRVVLRRLTGDQIELIPAAGQLPYCLVFTTSAKGVTRHLTITRENKSVPCQEDRPIGGLSYRIPVEEGAVRIHILFSDRKLSATSVAQQINEQVGNPSFTPMDLRLPGQVASETLEFTPQTFAPPATGAKVGQRGEVDGEPASKTDAGS